MNQLRPEPDESSPHPHITFLLNAFVFVFHLHLGSVSRILINFQLKLYLHLSSLQRSAERSSLDGRIEGSINEGSVLQRPYMTEMPDVGSKRRFLCSWR